VLALVVVLSVFAWYLFPAQFSPSPGSVSDATGPERAQIYYGPANSIAILPFSGSEGFQQQAFLPIGFSRELHRLFIRVTGLQVTSSNSSFYFKDQSVALPIVAERLQTRYLVSGEFLEADGQSQLVIHLFDAKKQAQTWSETWEWDPGDVFTIQDEIVQAVMGTLKPGREQELPRARPVNIEAWTAYLQGIHYRDERTTEGFRKAESAFGTALIAQPDYAMVQVAQAELWLGRYAVGAGDTSLVQAAREALSAALQSDPELPDALGLSSYLRRNIDWDWQGGLQMAERAIRLSPGDPELMSTASLAMFSLGQFAQAGPLLEASVRQDLLNLARRLRLGLLQEYAGEPEKALSTYRQIIGLNPDFPGVRAYRARIKLIQDKPDSALQESEQEADPFWRRYAKILALGAAGREQEAESLLDAMMAEDGDHSAFQLAEIFASRGDIEGAFHWLQRAYDQRDGGMSELIGNWFLGNLHDDPRWEEILTLMGLPLDSNR